MSPHGDWLFPMKYLKYTTKLLIHEIHNAKISTYMVYKSVCGGGWVCNTCKVEPLYNGHVGAEEQFAIEMLLLIVLSKVCLKF